MYTHFTLDDRFLLATLRNYEKKSFEYIADILGRCKTSVFREFNRNKKDNGVYEPRYAHHKAKMRRKNSKLNSRKIENNHQLAQEIVKELDPLTSPETICQNENIAVCFTTIYSWINRSRPELKKNLPHKGKKRRKKGSGKQQAGWLKSAKTIDEKPKNGKKKSWENDTMKGSTPPRIFTNVEEKSLYLKAYLIPNGTANAVYEALKCNPLEGYMICDRGSEFALWEMIEKVNDVKVYFADPYSPWQRGKNENTNGRLRRIFPKKFDFSTITQRDLDKVVWKMNHTKRKTLNWRTPCEVFKECCTSN